MNRQSINKIENASFENRLKLLTIIEIFKHKNLRYIPSCSIKEDGIFLSFGVDEDEQFWFQTSNSPPCYSTYEYVTWSNSDYTDVFVPAFVSLINKLQYNNDFRKFLSIQRSLQYPKKSIEFTCEWLSNDLKEQIDSKTCKYIRFPYKNENHDIIIFHKEVPFLNDSKIGLNSSRVKFGVEFKNPQMIDVAFADDLLYDRMMFLKDHLKFKECRDEFKEIFNDYINDNNIPSNKEGVILEIGNKLFKITNKEKPELNKKLFPNGEGRPYGRKCV